jgi:hypothetical protein
MLKKLPTQPQLEMFKTLLVSFINPQHELCLLAKKIDWDGLEKEFDPLYRTVGKPSIPILTIVGLLLFKQMYNLGDETVCSVTWRTRTGSTSVGRSTSSTVTPLIRVTSFTSGTGLARKEWRRSSSRASTGASPVLLRM